MLGHLNVLQLKTGLILFLKTWFEKKRKTSSVRLPILEERGLGPEFKNSERARSKHSYHDRTIFMLIVKIQAVIYLLSFTLVLFHHL